MNTFNKWRQKEEEDLMRKQGADDGVVLRAMRSIAEACRLLYVACTRPSKYLVLVV